jgi:hypothetical protein
MDAGKVSEYDFNGKEIRTMPSAGPWGVTPLKDGHILVTEKGGVREVDHDGKTVWAFAKADAPDYQLSNLQLAWPAQRKHSAQHLVQPMERPARQKERPRASHRTNT